MKKRSCFLMLIVLVLSLEIIANAQSQSNVANKSYLKMTGQEKNAFVTDRAREIIKRISGNDYALTASFEKLIQQNLENYARRIGNNNTRMWGDDLNLLLQRGADFALRINLAFDKNGMSRLMGLYICMIESEFHNMEKAGGSGGLGLFQFTAANAVQNGIDSKDRTEPARAANAAARYFKETQQSFEQYEMKEFLALLSYNRSPKLIEKDLKLVLNHKNQSCPICALTENAKNLDKQFQAESVKYLPKFFAAAIIGENPQAFDLKTRPLSSFELKAN